MGNLQSKIRVVILTDCLADLAGGAEKQIFELAKELNKERYAVMIASLDCEGRAPRGLIESIGCRLAVFPVKRIYGLSGFLEGFRFIRFLKQNRTDILMTYHFSSDIWGTVMAKIARVRTIISNRRDMGFWRSWRHIQVYKIINSYVHKVVVNSRAIQTLFTKEEGIGEEKIEVIHNGIALQDTRHPSKLKILTRSRLSKEKNNVADRTRDTILGKNLGIKKGDLTIIHVANIKPVKGHSYLIKALAKIVPQHPNIKLLLIGEDKLDGQMRDLVEKIGVAKNVVFLGKRDDVGSLIQLADICVLPSLSEGMSNSIMEYMEAGKPVIATRVGGNPELVDDNVTGLLVEKENVDSLEKALLVLIENPKKCASMGKKGHQKIVNEFSVQQMVSNYDKLFESFVSGKRMILHLISSSGLFGAENIVLTLGENVQGNGYHSTIGALHNSREAEVEVVAKAGELGIKTCTLKCNGRFDLGAIFRLKKYLTENKIDILHTHNYKSDVIGVIAAQMAGIPVIATAHGFTDMTRLVSVYEKLDRWVLRFFFNKVVVVTGAMLKNFPKEKKQIIPNGVNMSRFSRDKQKRAALRKKFNIGKNDILIGTMGRLSKEKNQKMFLEAVYPIMRNNENVKVMIVGSGPKEDELKQFGAARHLEDQIIFTGIMRDTASVYSAMDIFVLSSLTEGVPLTILESMASHLPVIATRVGGIPEIIIDGETGMLVDAQDTDALRGKIEDLMKDQDRRQQLTESAFEFVKTNCSVKHMCDAYRQVYEEVLNEIRHKNTRA